MDFYAKNSIKRGAQNNITYNRFFMQKSYENNKCSQLFALNAFEIIYRSLSDYKLKISQMIILLSIKLFYWLYLFAIRALFYVAVFYWLYWSYWCM